MLLLAVASLLFPMLLRTAAAVDGIVATDVAVAVADIPVVAVVGSSFFSLLLP